VALALARRHRPSLVLLDLNLPDVPGEEVLRRLRADPLTAGAAVVMISGDATSEQPARLRELGAIDYITKPFDIERLLDIVDRLGVGPVG
jgi:DNA-binding response OmpR family regulator